MIFTLIHLGLLTVYEAFPACDSYTHVRVLEGKISLLHACSYTLLQYFIEIVKMIYSMVIILLIRLLVISFLPCMNTRPIVLVREKKEGSER